MGQLNRVVWVALLVLGASAVGCNDEKKPPLTPDGPEMTNPVGGDAGLDMPPAPAPTASAPSK